MPPTKFVSNVDHYEKLAIAARVRTGPREVNKTLAALDGDCSWNCQVRVLFELARRGLVDLNAIAQAQGLR